MKQGKYIMICLDMNWKLKEFSHKKNVIMQPCDVCDSKTFTKEYQLYIITFVRSLSESASLLKGIQYFFIFLSNIQKD